MRLGSVSSKNLRFRFAAALGFHYFCIIKIINTRQKTIVRMENREKKDKIFCNWLKMLFLRKQKEWNVWPKDWTETLKKL